MHDRFGPDEVERPPPPRRTAVSAETGGLLSRSPVDRLHALQNALGNRTVARLVQGFDHHAGLAVQRCGPDGSCDACSAEVAEAPAVQRQPDGGGAPITGPKDAGTPDAAAATGPSIVYLTVRDPSIGIGGQVVPSLAALKANIMTRRQTNDWTLTIAIHGSLDRLAAQAPPDWQKDAVFYGAAEIKQLFGDDQSFVTWRNTYGPKRVVLLGCQVGATFEQVVADNLSRGGSGLRTQGLGAGCKPITSTQTISWGPTGKEKPVRSRADYARYDQADKDGILDELRKLNAKWGYLGQPPVADGDILRFYLDEEPKGAWAIVDVHKEDSGHNLASLDVPYWNRMFNSTFLHSCSMGVGKLPPRATP